MLEMVALGVTLVVANLLAASIMVVLTVKLMTSDWFIKKYFEWFMKTVKNYEKVMEDAFEEES